MSLPAEDGFRMPAEWQPHTRTWMAWPCRAELWGAGMDAAKNAYAAVARAIAGCEPVVMLARPQDAAEAQRRCGPTVTVKAQPLDDSWMRDIGPSFLLDGTGRLAGVDWRFNGWGGKYRPYAADDAVGAAVLALTEARRYAAPLVMEGGAIHVDGAGTVLTTEECLLNPNRNPHLSRREIEEALCAHLGAQRVVWLGEGLEDDETDGHVDNLAAFARPGLVLLLAAEPGDGNAARFADNRRRLALARDAGGGRLEVVEIPQPARREGAGGRLPLSYLNFYLANGAVICPSFADPADAAAEATLARVFPDRRVVMVPALDLVVGGGGIHCITQQQPRAAAG